MLKRTLEPEVMDSTEEVLTYNEMDHSVVNQSFVDELLANNPPAGEWLDLGAGTGLIPIEICRRSDTYRVVAVDLSPSMLDVARINLEIAGLTDQVLLEHADGKALDFEDDRFPVVMSNSIVHHVPEPEHVFREAVRVTASGGMLFFRDLMRPDSAEKVDQLEQQHVSSESEHARQLFRDSLHASLNLQEVQSIVSDLGFNASTVQATSDRHWTWIAYKM